MPLPAPAIYDFASDNTAGAPPEILDAIVAAAGGSVPSYGVDPLTERVERRFAELFERKVAVFPVVTGSAANALALAACVPPWGAVYCHADSHINSDECGAPEFFTHGAKLVPLPGADGKIAAAAVEAALAGQAGVVHHVQPAAIGITQASEAGTVYRADEIAALAAVARAHKLVVQMDGARFGNALATLGGSAADITWRAGVDILSFGATKGGALAAEAVIVFRDDLAQTIGYRRKRAGHLLSKLRFVSAQLDAYLEDGRWLRWAAHANAMATALAAGLEQVPGCRVINPVQANEVFVVLPRGLGSALLADGHHFYPWQNYGQDAYRLVTSFATSPDQVAGFVAAARRLHNA